MDATTFLKQLHQQVAEHPGVGHSLLGRMTIDPRSKADFKIFAGQHYALVSMYHLFPSERADADQQFVLAVPVDRLIQIADDAGEALRIRSPPAPSSWRSPATNRWSGNPPSTFRTSSPAFRPWAA
jgi:hypothetical protein